MATPTFPHAMMGPPPLPPGWTEHLGPGGQPYYHNAFTNESTYVRPLPALPIIPAAPAVKKKAKAQAKTPIPGTEWLRVKTVDGAMFFMHKTKKESVWTVPDDIRSAVEALEKAEAEAEVRRREEEEAARRAMQMREMESEVERVKREVEESVNKRKAEEPQPIDEVVVTKKARVEDEDDEDGEEDDEDSEEEDWQREAAAQLAAEAEEEAQRAQEEKLLAHEEARRAEQDLRTKEKEKGAATINMPNRVDLSLDEAKALFKTLLREKDINPLLPWDTALPLFISDPRYVLLPSVSARRDAFDEYCRDRSREQRVAKLAAQKAEDASANADPKAEFERLLHEEVKSTRTSWSEWRKTWKKDRRFWGWGRDDREREKRFREWLKELGEKKRAAAQKAEADFIKLLKEKGNIKSDSIWKEVKRKLDKDPRYDAVGSSSLREELFNTFLKTLSTKPALESKDPIPASAESGSSLHLADGGGDHNRDDAESADAERKRKEKAEKAVKDREEKVRAQRGRMEAEMAKSRMGLTREEGERDFRTLLTDAIRDAQATWDGSLAQLKTDPRFTNSPLPINQQIHLFHGHVAQLRTKHLNALHALFASYAASLATSFSSLPLPSLLSSQPGVKLGYDADMLQNEFDRWQRERTTAARAAFDEMLGENAFVEFWGRLGKIGGEGVDGGVKMDEGEDPDEGEGGGGKVDLKTLAKSVDVKEMDRVLKNDKRYIMFDHVPEQRERWLRDYLGRLAAPKLSVHVPDQGSST